MVFLDEKNLGHQDKGAYITKIQVGSESVIIDLSLLFQVKPDPVVKATNFSIFDFTHKHMFKTTEEIIILN